MQPGVHTCTHCRIDYKTLRKINPEAARLAVLGYLDSCGHNVAETARTFGLTRVTVYALERKRHTGSLANRPGHHTTVPVTHHPRSRSAWWRCVTRPT